MVSKGIPIPENEKHAKLMTALADELKKSTHMSMGECMALAGYLADRVVKEGWQWHPVATEENIDFNEFDLGYNRVALPDYSDPTPAQEVEIIDRIISGLPMEPVVLYDVASLYPQEFRLTNERKADELIKAANSWKKIPEFDNYEVNPLGVIRNRWTKRVIEVTEDGDEKYVAMHDGQGFEHAVNVNFVMEKVYRK